MASKLHITRIEDHEGFGRCGQCDRENLRWIVVLSDGTSCGVECAKKVLGFTPRPASYSWMTCYSVTAEYVDRFETALVYTHETTGRTMLVVNGVLQVNGGGQREFDRRYLPQPA